MAQSIVNIRMDENLKHDFDVICNELGVNMSTAITIFAKKMIRERRIPFDVSVDPFYSPKNYEALASSAAELEQGRFVSKTLEELEALADG